ncbi:MAG: phosphoribosylamine--glycine ligase [Rickettsiales bacterium]|nr:phosphoribosylamine--glycine ligase [Rickettsiales bacterium]
MKILVIGGGGREHAICWALKRSASRPELFCTPGNAGIAQEARCLNSNSQEEIVQFCEKLPIDLVIIGPEQPLVDGLSDELRAAGIAVIGPSAKAAQLEGSKHFTKELCKKYNIPTAASETFDNRDDAIAYVKEQGAPIVIKADGLAAGKGVTVAMELADAITAIEECFEGRFGEAGARVVVEDFLSGEEASFFALCDGERAIAIGSAQDHKRVGDGDTGPNTGGMGTYSPAPVVTRAMHQQVMEKIIQPAVDGMKADGIPYQGFLFAGLMIENGEAKLIEFNCRFGDPEAQVLMPRIENDLAELLYKAATDGLEGVEVSLSNQSALCVVMASQGYPGAYVKNSVIRNAAKADHIDNVKVFHAGTKLDDQENLLAVGGRVLGVTAVANTIRDAKDLAYAAVDTIDWPEGYWRRDIGWRAIKRKAS